MAGEPTGRTFTEGETYSLVESAVARETAEAKAANEELTQRLTAAETERDAALARATAAEADAAKAKTDHDEFVAEQERVKAQEAKRTERLDALKAAAPMLEVSTERADRIVAMSDEDFAEHVAMLKETASLIPPETDEQKAEREKAAQAEADKGKLPRESAAFQGTSPAGDANVGGGSVLKFLGTRRQTVAAK